MRESSYIAFTRQLKVDRVLEPMLESVLAEMGLSEADGIEIALLHERGQAYLEQGDADAVWIPEKIAARSRDHSGKDCRYFSLIA